MSKSEERRAADYSCLSLLGTTPGNRALKAPANRARENKKSFKNNNLRKTAFEQHRPRSSNLALQP
jgi:hypothetical protein